MIDLYYSDYKWVEPWDCKINDHMKDYVNKENCDCVYCGVPCVVRNIEIIINVKI